MQPHVSFMFSVTCTCSDVSVFAFRFYLRFSTLDEINFFFNGDESERDE